MYSAFLDAGYGPDFFWTLSIGEVVDLLHAYVRQQERRQEERKSITKDLTYALYIQAQQIIDALAAGLQKDARLTPLSKWYPDLFEESSEKQVNAELMRYQAQMENYAAAFNRRFEAKEAEAKVEAENKAGDQHE